MTKYTELIDKYLRGEMNATEKQDFENQLNANPALRAELEAQQHILQGIERAGIKSEITKGFKKGSFKTKAGKWMLGLAIAALAVTTVMVVKKATTEKSERVIQTSEQSLPLTNEEDNMRYELTEENNKNWSDADKQLPSQFFTLNGKRDTVIETKGGIILAIPAKSFIKNTGEEVNEGVEIEVKEALNPIDIMKAGLSTVSNGELLRTGGMFYINARKNGENLNIQGKGIYANIPTNERDKDMLLFDGERKQNGEINWVKPKRFENKLHPVNILSLDFYPEHFLDSLKRFGYAVKNKKLTDSIYYSFTCGKGINTESELAVTVKTSSSLVAKKDEPDSLSTNTPSSMPLTIAVCNSSSQIISENRPQNTTLAFSGCEIAPSRIRAIWDKKFNNTLLATKEFEVRLKAIFRTCNAEVLNLYVNNLDKKMYQVDSMASRLLEKDRPEDSEVFRKFYLRRDGGVAIQESHMKELQHYMEEKRSIYERTALKTLEELYKKERILDERAWQERNAHNTQEASRINKLFYEEVQTNLESAYGQLGKPYRRPASTNLLTNYHTEYVYWGVPAPYYYSAPITATGWKNVDAYAYQSAAKRQTLDYTDPTSGKKAVIRYTPITLHVKDSQNYDRVVAYLIPDKLSTFQKMTCRGNTHKENLNELIRYSAVVFGFKGNDIYFNSIKEATPGEQTLALSLMSRQEISDYSFLNAGARTDLISELNHEVFEQKESVRKKKIEKREEIRRKLIPVVFPCAVPPQPSAAAPDTYNN